MRRIDGLDDAQLEQVQKSAAPRALWRALIALEQHRAAESAQPSLVIRLALGDAVTRLPDVVAQLLKLSLDPALSSLFSIALHPHAQPSEVALALGYGEAWVSWEPPKGLEPWLLGDALGVLLPSGLLPMVEHLAFSVAVHETLRLIMNHMLSTELVEEIFSLLLCGLTSGHGLGFNRAVLFLWDPLSGCFRGHRAMGPDDQAQAHQIWEQLELDELSIEALLKQSQPAAGQPRAGLKLEASARALKLVLEDPLLERALQPRASALYTRDGAQRSALDVLDPASQFVLAPVGAALGLIFADNRYNQAPIDADHLDHLSFFLDQSALIWERLKARELIAYQAEHDPLTGALNRRAFERRLAEHLAQTDAFAIALIDVDRFKVVNDHLGHAEGDRRLRVVAQQLSAGFGQGGVLARYGGDEFVLLLSHWDDAQREQLIALCTQLARDEAISLSVGLSYHAASSDPQTSLTAQGLMLEADARLYEAKRRGRGQVVFDDGQAVSFA